MLATLLTLKFVHLAAMAIWFGAAIATPADVRHTLRMGTPHTELLLPRLRRTALWMNYSGYVTLLSGAGLIFVLGGWRAVPHRIHLGLALTLAIFVVGHLVIRPAIAAIGAAIRRGTIERDADDLAQRLARGVHLEHALRVIVLLLMSVPFVF